METNIIKYYGFLTRDEFEQYNCYKIVPRGFRMTTREDGTPHFEPQWVVESVPNTYPKSLVHAKIELRCRGLDVGDEDYGLARVLESGDVTPRNGMWSRDDVELAMISLAELGCIEPWILACKGFNIPPARYAEAMRAAIDRNIDRIGQDTESPLYYRFTFTCGKTMQEPGNVTITLRDDMDEVMQAIATKDSGNAQEEKD